MKFLLICSILLAALVMATNSEFLSERCDNEFTNLLSWARLNKDDPDQTKEMYCNMFQNVLKCAEYDIQNTTMRVRNRSATSNKLNQLAEVFEVVCFSCGGPTLYIWLLALPLAALLRPMN